MKYKKAAGLLAYLFWIILGFFIGLFLGRALWKC